MATTLYRFFDADDLLLYVGISDKPLSRFAQHSADKTWWPEVHSIKLWHFATREDAADAERALIAFARPPYNANHVGEPPAAASVKGEDARVAEFLRTRLVPDSSARISGPDLYAAYLESLTQPGPAPMSVRRFYAAAVRQGARKRRGTGGVMMFFGYSLAGA